MSLVITIVVVLVLVVLTLVGAWRDLRRGVTALAGTLLGALVSSFWADRWSTELVEHYAALDGRLITFVLSSALLAGTALLVGYGGGSFFPPPLARPTFVQRLLGALLGALSGVILTGYVLQYGAASSKGFEVTVLEAPVTRALYNGLPYLFLAMAGFTGLAVVLRAAIAWLLAARRAAPAAPAAASPPATGDTPATPAPAALHERQVNQSRTLDKINAAVQNQDQH
jgi:hypothetical protein